MWQKNRCSLFEIFFVNFWVIIFCPVFVQWTETRCSAIAERPRCRVRYSIRQK